MKRKNNETENVEMEVNSETENTQKIDNPEYVRNDEQFEKTFEESQNESEPVAIDVDAILSEYAPKKRGRKSKTEKQIEPESPLLIPGELLIDATDNIMVGAISWIDTMLAKQPIDAQLLALRQDQKTQLIPAANGAAKEISKYINANPILVFGAMLGAMYVSNYLIIRALMRQTQNDNK